MPSEFRTLRLARGVSVQPVPSRQFLGGLVFRAVLKKCDEVDDIAATPTIVLRVT
jgi:hypothetical protein